MSVAVSISSIESGVKVISGKVGLKGDDFTKAVKSEDNNSLANYEQEAAYALLDVMNKFCTGVTIGNGNITFTMSMPTNWGSSDAKVQNICLQYIINFVCNRWFSIVKPEFVAYYQSNVEKYEAVLRKELLIRNKPTRS